MDSKIVHTNWQPLTRRIIIAVEALPAPVAPSDDDSPIKVLSEFGRSADGFQLAIHYDDIPVAELMTAASSATDLTVRISSTASRILSHSRVTVSRSNISLASLLDLLTVPYTLAWRQTEDTLEISSAAEMDAEVVAALRKEAVVRSLRNALSTWPSHDLAPVTWLDLANAHARAGENDTALSLYAQFLRESPKSPLSATAWFNKAQLEVSLGKTDTALESLYQLVDRFAGNQLEARAWLGIGQLLVNDERFDEAERPLTRAATTARSHDVQARSAISLASAYLMSGKDSVASLVLMDYRDSVRVPPHDRVSAMLGTLARFRVSSGVRREGEGQRLISALAQLTGSDYEEDSIRLLAGEAWKDLGLYEQMASVYRIAGVPGHRSRLQQRMLFELADWLRQSGATDEALETFSQLDREEESAWRRQSRESRIRILLSAGKLDDCIAATSELLETASGDTEKRRLLELLGQAYEIQGNYTVAAQCYSGIVPDPAPIQETGNE